jgi:hypothetical protein
MKPDKDGTWGQLYSVFYLEDGRLLDISNMGGGPNEDGDAMVREGDQWVPFHGTGGQIWNAEPLRLAQLIALPPGTLPSRHGKVYNDTLFKAPDGTLFDISPVRDGEPPRKRVGGSWVPFTLPEEWIKKSDILTSEDLIALPEGIMELS